MGGTSVCFVPPTTLLENVSYLQQLSQKMFRTPIFETLLAPHSSLLTQENVSYPSPNTGKIFRTPVRTPIKCFVPRSQCTRPGMQGKKLTPPPNVLNVCRLPGR